MTMGRDEVKNVNHPGPVKLVDADTLTLKYLSAQGIQVEFRAD